MALSCLHHKVYMSVYCKYSFILPTILKPACKKLNILGFLRLDGNMPEKLWFTSLQNIKIIS
jgi:hypothetical protein